MCQLFFCGANSGITSKAVRIDVFFGSSSGFRRTPAATANAARSGLGSTRRAASHRTGGPMTKDGLFEHYGNGKRECPICNGLLPAHSTWPGARYRFCGRTECAARVKMLKNGRFVDPNSGPCRASGCSRFLPGGRYGGKLVFVACSPECYTRCQLDGSIRLRCGCGCGSEVRRPSRRRNRGGSVPLPEAS
jgi:hypothetical protein